ncbi:hypothetical protein [Dictyobacter vulcani]|nr:hypothetical protein [Dictyobacter vulcani]
MRRTGSAGRCDQCTSEPATRREEWVIVSRDMIVRRQVAATSAAAT